jgi:hypothetical protein
MGRISKAGHGKDQEKYDYSPTTTEYLLIHKFRTASVA